VVKIQVKVFWVVNWNEVDGLIASFHISVNESLVSISESS
jgi:hypothetical protein